ncbi:hypothetical protein FDECE_500 [Fusarium decemcellulare]|nr:hypothetical protein FDECE_500 [Fusarium decemcellulare]
MSSGLLAQARRYGQDQIRLRNGATSFIDSRRKKALVVLTLALIIGAIVGGVIGGILGSRDKSTSSESKDMNMTASTDILTSVFATVESATAQSITTSSIPTSTSTSPCIEGTVADGESQNYLGLCKFTCAYGYCPPGPCKCTSHGLDGAPPPPETGVKGCPLPGESEGYRGLCSFACNHRYCPPSACTTDC